MNDKGYIEFDGGTLWKVYANKPMYGHGVVGRTEPWYRPQYVGTCTSEAAALAMLEREFEPYIVGGLSG